MNDQPHNPFPAVIEGRIGDAAVQTVNARDLHAGLEVGKDFSNWIKDRIAAYDFKENSDFVCSPVLASEGRGGHNRLDYYLTIDMAKELSMVERNDAGKRMRAYFIDCERRLKDRPAFDPIAVLNDPGAMRGLLLTYTEKVLRLEAENAALGPKVDAHDRLAEAYGSYCITDAAKNLQVPPQVLFRWLRTNGWIYKRTGTNHDVAYQAQISAGRLIHKVDTYEKQDGTDSTRTQVRVTPKGMLALATAFPPAVTEVKKGNGGMAAALIGATMAAMAFASAPPAKALPAPVQDGLSVLQIDGKPVTVDTNRYKPEAGTKFAIVHFDGRMTVAPVEFEDGAPWYGKRSAATEWEAPGTGDLRGASAVRKRVWVLGAVVSQRG